MGTQVNLSRALREIMSIKELLKDDIKDDYTRGLYNGFELSWAIMNNKEPKYVRSRDIELETLPENVDSKAGLNQ